MKTTLISAVVCFITGLVTTSYGQTDTSNQVTQGTSTSATVTGSTDATAASDSAVALLDKAVSANSQGNNTATVEALQSGTNALETEAKKSSTSFKDKLLGQASNLKKLIPLAQTGALKGNILQKAVSLAKMAFAANKLQGLMGGGGNLLSNVGGLTSNLNILKGALPALGGGTASSGGSLINGALGTLSKLGQAGPAALAAEPAVRGQLNGILGFVNKVL